MTDVIIIGAGPAGMTAALYCLRNGKSVVLIEKSGIGGQIAEAPRVENYPTIESISGAELADRMFSQITNKGVEFKFGQVVKVEKVSDTFVVNTEIEQIEGRSVIIAAGVAHRKLNLENEEALIGHGVSYCALCDGAFFEGEDVVLIGDGNTALQYVLLLSSICKSVKVVTMFDKFFGDQALVDALKAKNNIVVVHNHKLVKLLGKDKLEGLVFEANDGSQLQVDTKALFVAIGQVPNNYIFQDLIEMENGFICVNENLSTKTPGLFAAGDCRVKKVRQVVTACGDGAVAATSACSYLQS